MFNTGSPTPAIHPEAASIMEQKLEAILIRIFDSGINTYRQSLVKGNTIDFQNFRNMTLADTKPDIIALVSEACRAAVEAERRENIGDKYDRLIAIAEKQGYEKALKNVDAIILKDRGKYLEYHNLDGASAMFELHLKLFPLQSTEEAEKQS